MKLAGRITGLVILLALFLPGCAQVAERARAGGSAQPAAGTASTGPARQVTILYTGYGRGVLDARETCT